VADLALAIRRSLESAVLHCAMTDDLPGDPPSGEKAGTRVRAPREAKVALEVTAAPEGVTEATEPAVAKPAKKKKRRTTARENAKAVEERIGHTFADPTLLTTALTHVSALKSPNDRAASYQRLEFLGDHVLGLVISDMLYRAFPKADEGELSKRLADLVRRETCADVARAMGLHEAIKLGAVGSAGAGERLRKSVLGDYLRGGDRCGLSRRRLSGCGHDDRQRMGRAHAQADARAARPEDGAAGVGAGQGPADTDLS
jgi:hypothetical protein